MRDLPKKRATARDKPVPVIPPRLIGYARVSTDDQSLDMQRNALLKAGVEPRHLHTDKISGVAKNRPGLEDALRDARRDDTLVVWKLDRFGRSLFDLLGRLRNLEERGIGFRSLTEGIDTTTTTGRLVLHIMGAILTEGIDTTTTAGRLVLHIMGAIAQFERDLIADRTKAGIKAHRERGGKMGPDRKFTPQQHRQMIEMAKAGKSLSEIGKHFGAHKMTVYLYVKKRKPKDK